MLNKAGLYTEAIALWKQVQDYGADVAKTTYGQWLVWSTTELHHQDY